MADRSTSTKLQNTLEQDINPATKEKQDSQLILTTTLNGLITTLNSITAQDETLKNLARQISFLADNLQYGAMTTNGKILYVDLNRSGNLNAINSITNIVRQGDLQVGRVNEALLDIAFANTITNNIY